MLSRDRTLLFAGMLLFLIGIFSGLIAQLLLNPRLAVSGHLEGVLNGMFLILVGLIWPRVKLQAGPKKAAMGLLIFGSFANWLLTMLGAMWGTKKLTPIAGAGYEAAPWQELFMTAGLGVMIIGMVAGVGMTLWGLRGDDAT